MTIKDAMQKQDDGSLELIARAGNRFYKTYNRWPYTPQEITEDEYNRIKARDSIAEIKPRMIDELYVVNNNNKTA